MIYDLLILGISIWLLYDIFLMYKVKNKSQVLIEFILFAVLIAGYLINKLYEINYFVSDTYFLFRYGISGYYILLYIMVT